MAQHFLLSAKARTLSLVEVARMTDDEAYAAFKAVRFADNGGVPACPHCGSIACYSYEARRIFKCKACEKQFSATSGTIFHSRKLPMRDILLAIVMFVNGVNGHSALRLSRDLRCDYKTAFVLAHKLREVLGAMQAQHKLTGVVEIDGAEFGGYRRPSNLVADRADFRKLPRHPKRQTIVTMRERRRGGRSLSFAVNKEADAFPLVLAHIDRSASIRTDDASHWRFLEAYFDDVAVINHTAVGYSHGGVNTNLAESFHSRLRRGEQGIHCHISGRHLQGYADEYAWREDHRRVSNGVQFASVVRRAATLPSSQRWRGYWQRGAGPSGLHPPAEPTPTA